MKLRNIIKVIAGAAILLGTTACSDSFLDEKMYSNYPPEVDNIEAKVVGLHRQYAGLWGWSGAQGFVACWQIGTDVASPGSTEVSSNPFYQYQNLNGENASLVYMWEKLYEIINSANQIIALVEDESNPVAKGEAKFFRAYAYNMLVTLWGKVPLVLESTTVPKTDYIREEIAKIDQVIEDDLTYAINTGLPNQGAANLVEGRITKDMARQLAAEVYLRIGMRDASYFKKAEDVIDPVITEGRYSLITERYGKFQAEPSDYYADMFRWGNQRYSQGNKEGIWVFQMEYGNTVTGGTIDNPQHRRNWVCAYHKTNGMANADSLGGRGNGRLRLSNFVKHKLFEKGDIRNSNYNIRRDFWYNDPDFKGEEIYLNAAGFRVNKTKDDKPNPDIVTTKMIKYGDKVIPFENDSLEVIYPHPTKWGAYNPNDDFGYAMVKDWPVMRLGETYLLRAEARFRQGNTSGAADDINILRDRAFKESRIATGNANLGKVSESDIDIDFILDERARELISEENRRMTLMRTNKLADRIPLNGDTTEGAPADKVITGFDPNTHILLPIPTVDGQLNKDNKWENNPGYSGF